MPIKPLPIWQSEYENKIKETIDKQNDNPNIIQTALQDWIDSVAKGLQVSAPYISTATPNKSNFAPIVFPRPGTPVTAATVYANAWFFWYMAIQWQPHGGPPPPPFSQVTFIASSAMGAATAQAKLLANLIAEFSNFSTDISVIEGKTKKVPQYFYEATMSAGVQITGLGIGAPPPPLFLPQIPAF